MVEAASVDLTGEPEYIEASVRKAAKRLVEHVGILKSGKNMSPLQFMVLGREVNDASCGQGPVDSPVRVQ